MESGRSDRPAGQVGRTRCGRVNRSVGERDHNHRSEVPGDSRSGGSRQIGATSANRRVSGRVRSGRTCMSHSTGGMHAGLIAACHFDRNRFASRVFGRAVRRPADSASECCSLLTGQRLRCWGITPVPLSRPFHTQSSWPFGLARPRAVPPGPRRGDEPGCRGGRLFPVPQFFTPTAQRRFPSRAKSIVGPSDPGASGSTRRRGGHSTGSACDSRWRNRWSRSGRRSCLVRDDEPDRRGASSSSAGPASIETTEAGHVPAGM